MTLTMTRFRAAKSLQVLGLAMVVAGVVATQLAPACGSSIWAQAGIVAALLDVGAIAIRRGDAPIAISLIKLIVVGGSIMVAVSCARVALPPPPFPPDTAFSLMLGSVAPSFLGALLLRFAR